MTRFPILSTVFVLGAETAIEAKQVQRQEPAEMAATPPVQQKPPRKSNRQQGVSPESDLAQHGSLSTNVDEIEHASYEHAECAPITGEAIGHIGAGKPGEIGYLPPDPRTHDDVVSGVDAAGWCASMAEERRSLIEHARIRVGRPARRHSSNPFKDCCTLGGTTKAERLVDRSQEWYVGSAGFPRG